MTALPDRAGDWRPESWQDKPLLQQPTYDDRVGLARALSELRHLPPLVTSWEVNELKRLLAQAQAGRLFVLQGGDCAESFADCRPEIITNRLKVMLQMSLVLAQGMRKRVVRVGRFAGQYAKPRSADLETRNGQSLPSYRGDLVNAPEFTAAARTPDPRRLVEAHARSAMTMNFVRGLIDGGFADLHHPEYWDLDWAAATPLALDYRRRVDAIAESVQFVETLVGASIGDFGRVDFFTSHEALLLWYEQAQTREVPRNPGWYNLSTHFPWIGMRTSAPEGAHVEYCRGIRNPVGVKVGTGTALGWIEPLCELLDPGREAGRLTFIHRFGATQIGAKLPPMVEAVKALGREVLWICDPMHGNTRSTANGTKTRRFEDILSEVEQAFAIHRACGTRLGGVHLELTGENVTECLGGARALSEADLERAYRTQVDPRLNYEQALELSFRIATFGAPAIP